MNLNKENLRLTLENQQLKKKLAQAIREYQELARFCQEREAVSDAKQDHQRIHLHE